MAIPENWQSMDDISVARTVNEIREFINWTYDADSFGYIPPEDQTSVISAIFDFRVFMNINSGANLEIDSNGNWEGSITHRIVDISGVGRGFDSTLFKTGASSLGTQDILLRDILGLSHVVTNTDGTPTGSASRLPKREDFLFGTYGPVIDTISVKQEGESPDVWLMTFRIKKFRTSSYTLVSSGSTPESMRETPPWEQGVRVSVSGGTESYVLGLGYRIDSGGVTAEAVGDVITSSGSLSSYFVADASSDLEICKNTAGDPFKNPPPMKIPLLTINIENSFVPSQNLTNFTSNAASAMTTVNDADTTLTSLNTEFKILKGSGICTSYGITPSVWNEKADWLPGQAHPFGKTYAQVGWTPPKNKTSTDVAKNPLKEVLSVTNAVSYKIASMTIVVNPMGWGVFIPNKGYRQKLVAGQPPVEVETKNKKRSGEVFLDSKGKKLDDSNDAIMLAYSVFKGSASLQNAMSQLIEPTVE